MAWGLKTSLRHSALKPERMAYIWHLLITFSKRSESEVRFQGLEEVWDLVDRGVTP